MKKLFIKKRYLHNEIDPDEVLLDATNLPKLDTDQFEGRLERPIQSMTIFWLGLFCACIGLLFLSRIFILQVSEGANFRETAENNRLSHTVIFADRGVIYDRNGELLAWNIPKQDDTDYNLRSFIDERGFAHLLGYVTYPQQDSAGFYYETKTTGLSGLESVYNDRLAGRNGLQIVERDALNTVTSSNIIQKSGNGDSLKTSIDVTVQKLLYQSIKDIADEKGFEGGTGAIMDVTNGEIIAMTSYPEFDSNIMTTKDDQESINDFFTDSRNVFLNRLTQGVYTPGSIIKPFVAMGALEEKVVTPDTVIVSTGSITVPNPYFPDKPSVFNDWRAHGPVNVRTAIAKSSNVYFYEVGGGFQGQKGIGIDNVEKYVRAFGYGNEIDHPLFNGPVGTIPNPDWKERTFDGDPWRLGDTYFTSIGQYGFQVAPIQALRAMSGIANGGEYVEPKILIDEKTKKSVIKEVSEKNIKIVQEGLRLAASSGGTAQSLNVGYVDVAAKTGTAEIGTTKSLVNSWVLGYYPYEKPKYTFVLMMERGGRSNLFGAPPTFRRFMDSLHQEDPAYFEFE